MDALQELFVPIFSLSSKTAPLLKRAAPATDVPPVFEPIPSLDPQVKLVSSCKDTAVIMPSEFALLQSLCGKSFTVDACCNDALCNLYGLPQVSPAKDAHLFDFSGHHSWVYPTFKTAFVTKILARYRQCKAASPADTSACFLLPAWDKPEWQQHLQGMEVLHKYPAKYHLFHRVSSDNPAKRARMSGIQWPVKVWYDPPGLHAALDKLKNPDRPTMQMHGQVAGVSAQVLVDSGAMGHAYVSQSFCTTYGLKVQPYSESAPPVYVVDGSVLDIVGMCKFTMRLGSYKGTITAQVLPMHENMHVLLGDSWLREHKAILDYESECLTIVKGSRRFTVRNAQHTTSATPDPATPEHISAAHVISALQLKRAQRKGAELLVAYVTKEAPQPLEVETAVDVSPAIKARLQDIITKHSACFVTELPGPPVHTGEPQRAVIQAPGSHPVRRGMFRYSPAEMKEIETRIKFLLDKGLIQPSQSPYASPVLFARKKDGTLRM